MKIKGTQSGITICLNKGDKPESVSDQLEAQEKVLKGHIIVEVENEVSWEVVKLVADTVSQAGGKLSSINAPLETVKRKGETKIIAKTVRSGGRVESSASVVILADVNAGAEIIAQDDIIVLGVLRGIAHAGVNGNDKAVIWAKQILSPQLRIADIFAQDEDRARESLENKHAEVAHIVDEQIIVRPWR